MKSFIKDVAIQLMTKSLISARKENKYIELADTMEQIVPDISQQYTEFTVDSEYMNIKVRSQHAFQMDMIAKACEYIEKNELTVVDIGDSSGTHIQYMQGGAIGGGQSIDALSVNLDPEAVKKIKDKGLSAVCCRAEDLHNSEEFSEKEVDLFLSFETVEHLLDPIRFLHELSTKAKCKYFVITVPYLAHSRVGLHQIRNNRTNNMVAENTHIFELCPEDWKLLFQFSGWRVVSEKIYYQYPRSGIYRLFQPIWKKLDFEGFYGVVLEKDSSIADKYKSW